MPKFPPELLAERALAHCVGQAGLPVTGECRASRNLANLGGTAEVVLSSLMRRKSNLFLCNELIREWS